MGYTAIRVSVTDLKTKAERAKDDPRHHHRDLVLPHWSVLHPRNLKVLVVIVSVIKARPGFWDHN